MTDMLELTYGRFRGGQAAPVGTYLNPHTLDIIQLTTDGTLPGGGIFVRVDPSATQEYKTIAETLNTILGTAYNAGSFHNYALGEASGNRAQASNGA